MTFSRKTGALITTPSVGGRDSPRKAGRAPGCDFSSAEHAPFKRKVSRPASGTDPPGLGTARPKDGGASWVPGPAPCKGRGHALRRVFAGPKDGLSTRKPTCPCFVPTGKERRSLSAGAGGDPSGGANALRAELRGGGKVRPGVKPCKGRARTRSTPGRKRARRRRRCRRAADCLSEVGVAERRWVSARCGGGV